MKVTPTRISFCHQTWQSQVNIQYVENHEQSTYVITDATPFHPVSHIWPDHPADTGVLIAGNHEVPVLDCQVGAVELDSGQLYVGAAIPVKRDTEGWVFVVVHCLALTNTLCVGDQVTLVVDKAYQQALSRGHTAGHLAYLALNKVLAEDYWRKDAERKDPHGYCDFNSYAQVTSFVTEDKCLDTYRLGKTLRKRGLNSADMLSDLKQIEAKVNTQLMEWLAKPVPVVIDCQGPNLTDSRYWQCDLGEGQTASIPCGGTHCCHLNELAAIEVTLVEVDGQTVEMHTNVTAAN
ncbi:alanyl-tRNA editing protein [Vibrio sp. CAU 1672]|uniref:alanyl-tRNA editing protein n=1 Tax=Vibrio sp. CAU 1672 TaxID=3032594 RepID=UPI0023D9813A|nr:alanyl-tRNA editing protein [Vibrio sp. CAU 1672]MDF2155559.1 alanyl-tRNA editing protein [Vibrio sp. CAU 1672]